MRIERKWAMPNHRTFQIPIIKKFIEENQTWRTGTILEPFPFESKIDCFDYLKQFDDSSIEYALVDPPYSRRQVSEHYKSMGIKVTGWHTSSGWTRQVKDEVARILKPRAKVISFGWNSNGMGMKRGFEITRILLVAHGADHNDTICTAEVKT